MFFFRLKNKNNFKQIFGKQTLRARILTMRTGKRMSRFPSYSLHAGMAVEASVAVPLFLFFVITILSAFAILQLHGSIAGAVHQVGNKMTAYGYAYRNALGNSKMTENGVTSLVLSEGYARSQVVNLIGEEALNKSCLVGGAGGLHFYRSSVMREDDIIELIVSYQVKTFANVFGLPELPMENRYYGRAWTGYDVEKKSMEQGSDPIVFVSETGTVYHPARNCSYLNPSVRVASAYGIQELRNENGGKYYACGSCGESGIMSVIYVTDYGSKYHGSVRCSGLKRTVYAVRLSETNGKGQCAQCGT